ncbi:MAG: adenine nucleotide alpha hydrolase family protein [Thermoplasmatota archaeon]
MAEDAPGVLVVLDPAITQLRRLIRRGTRIARQAGGTLLVVDVQTSRDNDGTRSVERLQRVRIAWEYALEEGILVERVKGDDWVTTVLRHARATGCQHLVLGHERRGFGMGIWSLQNMRRLLDGAGGLDIHILSFEDEA